MTQPNDGGLAFPRTGSDWTNAQEGMTLRDWFAGKALEGLCSGNLPFCPDQVSATAYGYADAMIKARSANV